MKKEANYLRKEEPDVFAENACGRYQQFLWDLMEKPDTSIAAKVRPWIHFHSVQLQTVANSKDRDRAAVVAQRKSTRLGTKNLLGSNPARYWAFSSSFSLLLIINVQSVLNQVPERGAFY